MTRLGGQWVAPGWADWVWSLCLAGWLGGGRVCMVVIAGWYYSWLVQPTLEDITRKPLKV